MLKKNWRMTVLLFILIISVVVCSLIPPQILKFIIDEYLAKRKENQLVVPAFSYLLSITIVGVLEFFKEVILLVAGQKITNSLRSDMIEKLRRLPSAYFSEQGAGSLVSRFTNDIDTIQDLFSNGIVSMIIDSLKIIGIIVSIFMFSTYLGLFLIILLPFLYFLTRYFQTHMLKAQLKNRVLIGLVNNYIPETVNHMEMIQSFHKEKYMEEKYKKYVSDSHKTIEKVNFYDAIFSPIVIVIRAVVISVMVILCSEQVMLLDISIGMVAAAIELISNLFTPIENLGIELQNIQQAVAGVKRVNEFLTQPEENEKNEHIKEDNYVLSFQQVGFEYEKEQMLFCDFSCIIKENEKITFRGRTGAGKSTLFKLILGLMKPTKGAITLNGTDVNLISSKDKRKLFGYVEQQFSFVPGSIERQICLGDETISFEEVRKVMKFVGLDEYIMGFENGYHTDVKKVSFSSGQCQLLSIARALVTNPPIMLLDEITANLDSETEKKIIDVIQRASEKRMLLSISHRLSTSLKCDRIILIENGKISIK